MLSQSTIRLFQSALQGILNDLHDAPRRTASVTQVCTLRLELPSAVATPADPEVTQFGREGDPHYLSSSNPRLVAQAWEVLEPEDEIESYGIAHGE